MKRLWPSAFLSRWRGDRRGLAAVEFALLLPVMLILYLGGFQLTQAISAYRKLSDTTVELANVTAQYQTMATSDMNTVLGATSQIMVPFSTSNLSIVLSEVMTGPSNPSSATVKWSVGYQGGTALACNATVTLPTGMGSPNTYYILAKTNYSWSSIVPFGFLQNIPMSDQIYMIPRQSAQILYPEC